MIAVSGLCSKHRREFVKEPFVRHPMWKVVICESVAGSGSDRAATVDRTSICENKRTCGPGKRDKPRRIALNELLNLIIRKPLLRVTETLSDDVPDQNRKLF